MKERIFTVLACVVVIAVFGVAFLHYAYAQSAVCESVIQGAQAGKSAYGLGETVRLTFAVRNPCNQAITYTFSSSKQYDLWVKRGETEIYRLSKGRFYTTAITHLELRPGETKTFDIEWDQKDNQGKSVGPGIYEVYAQLTPTQDIPPAVKTKVQIGRTSMAVAPIIVRDAIRLVDSLKGRKVQISGTYRGWQPDPNDPNTKSGPPVTRSDWAVCDSTGCMYVNGSTSLNPDRDLGAKVTVTGKLVKGRNGQVYMVSENVTIEQPTQSTIQTSAQLTAQHVSSKYYYTAELAYLDIQLTDSRLAVVYLPTSFKPKRDGDYVPRQAPEYKSSDLKHAAVKLADSEVDQFVQLVKSSGFFELNSHSGAPDGVRYYPINISMELNGKVKDVEYRSYPDSTPKPRAFSEVEGWLMKTARANFKEFPGSR